MLCRQDHTPIAFNIGPCPLCVVLSKLEAAEADRDHAREQASQAQADIEALYQERPRR